MEEQRLKINSREYWDYRFQKDWELRQGVQQSRFFASLAVENMPKWLIEQIVQNNLTIADWGCALGDGTDALSSVIPAHLLTGIDISSVAIEKAKRCYPHINFLAQDWLLDNKDDVSFDVIFSSNTLEHFVNPWDTLEKVSIYAKKAIVLLLPYREEEKIEEHFYTFLPENIPLVLPTNFILVWSKVIDCKNIPNTMWFGEQILLVYANYEWLKKLRLTLSDIYVEHIDNKELIHQLVEEKNKYLQELNLVKQEREKYFEELKKIYTSDFWKLASFYYRLRDKTPLSYAYKTISILKREGIEGLVIRARGKLIRIKDGLCSRRVYSIEFNPYERLNPIKPIEVIVIDRDYSISKNEKNYPAFSVVVPVKNEEKGIEKFLNSLIRQTVIPGEIIVVDGGSTDKTVEKIKKFVSNNPQLKIKLLLSKGESLAKDRNLGLREAKYNFVVFIDAGCDEIPQNLLENLVGVIEDYPEADLVAGIYKPVKESFWAYSFVFDWSCIDFTQYLPSARAVLIKKDLALSMGGFPEFLPYTGEDTLFDLNYRKVSKKWIINKSAVIYWEAPATREEALKKAFLYGKGDGENGYGDFRFYDKLVNHLKGGKLTFYNELERENFRGYLEGRKNRFNLLIKNGFVDGLVLFLSGVPFTDSGGGQRGTQLALEFMKRKYKVTFCNIYPSFEKFEKIYLEVEYPLLELYHLKDFCLEDFVERHKEFISKLIVILEFPHPDFIPIIRELKEKDKNVIIVYDCIDNWDSNLGWVWYTKEKEMEIIDLADVITCSAKTLKERLENITDKPVFLIPNAVNINIFRKEENYSAPSDLPLDKPIIMYVGALWGDWFDWELLQYLAENLGDFYIVLIGNVSEDRIKAFKKFTNIKFLGLKQQIELPRYLSYATVCIIPFKYDEKIIKYTNPLKVYEYLSIGKPVVATFMDELVGIPFVYLSKSKEEFRENVKKAMRVEINKKELDKFILHNSWSKRVEDMLHLINNLR